jgi:NO-binding membrane sensor protein with MHYT domain
MQAFLMAIVRVLQDYREDLDMHAAASKLLGLSVAELMRQGMSAADLVDVVIPVIEACAEAIKSNAEDALAKALGTELPS